METRVYAVKLTEENIDEIIELGNRHDHNLEDFRDDIVFNTQDGEDTYVIVTVWQRTGHSEVAAITTKPARDFFDSWQFTGATYLMFTRVVQI